MSYECSEKINQLNLRKIIKAGKYKNYVGENGQPSDAHHNKLVALQRDTRKTGCHKVTFIVKDQLSKKRCFGRMYPKHSKACLQGLPRDVRKALAYDRYSDVDIVNAHPTILNQLFERHGIHCDLLDNYVRNRDEVLGVIDSCRDRAKVEINKAINNGWPRSEYGRNLKDELMDCYDRLLSLQDFEDYRKWGEVARPDNPIGSAINCALTDFERKAVSIAIYSFQNRGYVTSTIIHDGFLVEHLDVNVELLFEIQQEIKRKMGLDLSMSVKTMNDYDTSKLWDEEVKDEQSEEMGDADAAELFYERITRDGHQFKRCGAVTWWYNPEDGLWRNDLTTLRRYMKEIIPGTYGQMSRKQDNMMLQFKAIILEDPELMKRSTRGLLPFNNGVWDFKAKMLKPFSPDYFFTHKLPWDYGEVDSSLVSEIREKLVEGVFGKLGDYYLKVLARAIAGNVDDKVFNVCIGDSNSGKGCNTDALFGAFPGFVSNINASNFAFKRSDGDGAKNRSWMVGCSQSRLLICNEISMKDALDGNIIKTVSSGGDPITARQNYKDELEFIMSGTAFVFANDMPSINPVDDAIQNRMRYIETAYSYLDGHMYESKKSLEHVRLADPDLKTVFLKREDVLRTFALMVVGEWRPEKPVAPEEVIKATKEWTQADDVVEKLNGLFEISENPDDFVSAPRLKTAVTQLGLDISDTKMGRTMTKLGFKSIQKKVGGRKMVVYMGVKLVGEIGDFVDF